MAVTENRVRITDHAHQEMESDGLSVAEVYRSTVLGEIIEDYPNDYPHPSCLVFGYSDDGAPIHSVWGYNQEASLAVLITVYRPDPELWVLWRFRRSPDE